MFDKDGTPRLEDNLKAVPCLLALKLQWSRREKLRRNKYGHRTVAYLRRKLLKKFGEAARELQAKYPG